MKNKVLNVLLILTSLVAYLEWGQSNSTFLFSAEADLLVKLFTDPLSVIHPFTIIPLIGQLLLLVTIFQEKPNKALTFAGIVCLSLLLLFIFVIGIMGLNVRIIASTLPFIITSIYTILSTRKRKPVAGERSVRNR